MSDRENAYVPDAPHPWTYHDPGGTGAPGRITDDNGNEVSIGRAWREVQRLRTQSAALREAGDDMYRKMRYWKPIENVGLHDARALWYRVSKASLTAPSSEEADR